MDDSPYSGKHFAYFVAVRESPRLRDEVAHSSNILQGIDVFKKKNFNVSFQNHI